MVRVLLGLRWRCRRSRAVRGAGCAAGMMGRLCEESRCLDGG